VERLNLLDEIEWMVVEVSRKSVDVVIVNVFNLAIRVGDSVQVYFLYQIDQNLKSFILILKKSYHFTQFAVLLLFTELHGNF
jgi:hypothetical protein